jgi:diacylglycerol O-acyltransferase / wax synthase
MKQLSAIDAGFLYAETSRTPMHVTALQIYEPGTAPFSFAQIVDNVRQRAASIECYHRKLVTVPWGLDHPYWINDADFDPSHHMFEYTLAEPGGWTELCAATAELHAKPLDRSKPLWEMHIIPALGKLAGVADNAYAIVTKIHHAAVDGLAGISVTAALHDLEPAAPPVRTPEIAHEARPTPMALLSRSSIKDAVRPLRALYALPSLARAGGSLPTFAPRTRFNGRVSGRRAFNALDFQLESLQTIKRLAPGATINDVVLTIVGGGLRRYLQAHNELPDDSLTAMIPVSTRTSRAQSDEGNRISQIVVPVGTHIDNATDRLRAIQQASAAAKKQEQYVDKNTTGLLAQFAELTPAPWLAFAAQTLQPKAFPPLANTVITNVKAPPIPLYSCGAKLVRAYGTGPLVDGAALFHAAMSYCGALNLSVTSCAEILPDLPFYLRCLQDTYAELTDAVASHAEAPKPD